MAHSSSPSCGGFRQHKYETSGLVSVDGTSAIKIADFNSAKYILQHSSPSLSNGERKLDHGWSQIKLYAIT